MITGPRGDWHSLALACTLSVAAIRPLVPFGSERKVGFWVKSRFRPPHALLFGANLDFQTLHRLVLRVIGDCCLGASYCFVKTPTTSMDLTLTGVILF